MATETVVTKKLSNYTRGRRREYQTQTLLELDGYITVRSAASKGVWDICAVGPHGDIRFISVKGGSARPSPTERVALRDLAKRVLSRATVEVWAFADGSSKPAVFLVGP